MKESKSKLTEFIVEVLAQKLCFRIWPQEDSYVQSQNLLSTSSVCKVHRPCHNHEEVS